MTEKKPRPEDSKVGHEIVRRTRGRNGGTPMNGFPVMSRLCATCIYRKSWCGTPVATLEDQVRDRFIGFKGYRVCHSQRRGRKACCRGFWNRHKWGFAAGQIAQRLGLVEFVEPTQ